MEIKGNDDNEQIARLSRENRVLREQLTAACTKLERVQITLRSLSESMLNHISDGSACEPDIADQTQERASDDGNEDATTGDSTAMTAQSQLMAASHAASDDPDQCVDEVSGFQTNMDAEQLLSSKLPNALPTGEDHDAEGSSFSINPIYQARQDPMELDISRLLGSASEVRSLPDIWTHEYQMGIVNFQARSPSAERITQGLGNTNSSFSDHMQMIRGCLNIRWQKATQALSNIEASQVIS